MFYMILYVFFVSGLIFWMYGHVFWMSGHVFWMSGLVFWMSGYVFWTSGLVFRISEALVWPTSASQALFSWTNNIPGLVDYVNSGNCQNCQHFNIYWFGDLSKKKRTEKSWILRFSDLQISHGEPFGEQSNELNFGHQTRIRFSGVANIMIFQETIKKNSFWSPALID